MKGIANFRVARAALALSAAALVLGACGYDYMQRSDRISYSAGNAVAANLERETANPSKGSMNDTSGLGKDGIVVPDATPAAPPAP